MAQTSAKPAKRSEGLGAGMVLLAAALWGANGIFVNLLTADGLSSTQITFTRMCSVPVIAWIALMLTDRNALHVARQDVKWFALNGVFGVYLFSLLYAVSIQFTGMATAAVLIYLMPSLVMVFSILFLGERFTGRKGLCLVLSLLGCALVSGLAGGLTLQVTGLLAGIGAALCYTVYNIMIATKLKAYAPLTIVLYSGLFAALMSLLYTAFRGELLPMGAIYEASPAALVLNIFMGFACSVVTYFLYNSAVKIISPSKASILATFEPIAAALFGLVLFHEMLDGFGWLGIVCEIAALVLLQLPEKKPHKTTV